MAQLYSGWFRISVGLAAASILTIGALPAFAQTSPFEPRTDHAPPKPRNATSDLEATAPTAEEQRETRALASAVFAKPAAAARAADKAAPVTTPDLASPVQPKPEWSAKDGVQIGGKGLQIKSPF
jgi:hypothetical protein